MNYLKSLFTLRVLIGLIAGAAIGYAYGYYVGCNGGTCPLTSNPMNTAAYFALLGGVLLYKPEHKK